MKEKIIENKKTITVCAVILIILLIIILIIVNIKDSKTNSSINEEKTQKIEFKKENKEFFDEYLKQFQNVYGKGIGYNGKLTNEDYSKFVVLYFYDELNDPATYTFTVSKNKVDDLMNKYFGVTDYKIATISDFFTIDNYNNTYKITINPIDYGYDVFKIKSVQYDNKDVIVKYNIYRYEIDDKNLVGEKIFKLKYEYNNYHIKSIKSEYNSEYKNSNNNNNKTITKESKEFFTNYLSAFQFCDGNSLKNIPSFDRSYGPFVSMYYINKNKDNNINEISVPENEVYDLLHKYFGASPETFRVEKEWYSINKVGTNFVIKWKSVGCGYTEYKIKSVEYNGNIITVVYDIYNGVEKPEITGQKTFTLEYIDGDYRVKNIRE